MRDDPTFDLATFPVHLGLGATVEQLERFDGSPDWYARYGAAHATDGDEGRLVSIHTFDASWDTWEMHPRGAELVLCVAGEITLHQETATGTTRVTLTEGRAVVNPPGTWHTADVDGRCTAVFVTAGAGTEVRER